MSVPSEDEISYRTIFLKTKRWAVFFSSNAKKLGFGAVVGILGGIFYFSAVKPIYKATLSFALEDEKSGGGMMGAMGLASQFGLDIGGAGGAFSGENLIALMKSRNMVEKALMDLTVWKNKKISIAELYIQFNQLREQWYYDKSMENFTLNPFTDRRLFSLQQDSILGLLSAEIIKENLKVVQQEETNGIIDISVKSTSEFFSKCFTEALVREVSRFYIESKSKKAKINLDNLTKQLDSVKIALNNAIAGVATANDNTFNLNPSLNINRVSSVRRQVDVQANTAILIELVKNSELAKVTLRKETPLIQIIDRPILPLYKEKTSLYKCIIIGATLGALIGLAILLFLEFIKRVKHLISG